jgi:GNAT superfamily N-acetyltransferase
MSRRITAVDRRHAAGIDALRLGEYAGSRGFTVQPPGILWNRSDDQATVLAAWDGDEIVATLRAELIEDAALIEAKLECPWDFPQPLERPAVVLGKMATRKAYRRSGLNWALRAAAFELVAAWGARQVLGTFVQGSPRQAPLAEMGYRFFPHPSGWGSPHYRSQEPVLVCMLDWAAHGEQALAHSRALAGPALAEYPWEGPRPDARLVTVLR